MTKRKKVLSVLAVCAIALGTTGCGDEDIPFAELLQQQELQQPIEVVPEPITTPEGAVVQGDIPEYASGNAQETDYITLARKYVEENRNKEARDALETLYRLEQSEEALAALQEITVNAAEEEAMAQQLDLLIQNLSAPEYANESISMLFTEEWFDAMMPRLSVGKRSYYREVGETTLYVEVGYNEQKQKYTSIWKKTGEELMILQQTLNTLQSVITGVQEGEYHGAFEAWTCVASTGDVFHETGTYEAGVCVGDYTADVKWGKDEADIMSLWTLKEDMEFTTYFGNFLADGKTTMEQLEKDAQKVTNGGNGTENSVIYAYDEDGKNYLFVNVEEGVEAASLTFTNETFGLSAYPDFEKYEPAAVSAEEEVLLSGKTVSLSALQVRIFDSNIQIYDGTQWITMGSVAEYEAEDPLAGEEVTGQPQEGEDTPANVYENRGEGKVVVAATAKPQTTKAPTATKAPSATPVPATPVPATPVPATPVPATPVPATPVPATPVPATPAPATPVPATPAPATPVPATPAPATPAPATPAPATPAPATPAPATPAPATPAPETPTQTPSGGNDTDVEWTPDIM